MIDLVITHLTHPWGPPGTLEWAISPLKSPEIPIKNENGLQFVISWSITLKIVLWAPYTIWQAVLKGQVILRQKANFEPDYCLGPYRITEKI